MDVKYLDKIEGPSDIKKLDVSAMNILADEIRYFMLQRVSTLGGHVAPNLGMVEATIALHYVFDSPTDKIVFDVSHQCYPHKLLTGRKDGFMDSSRYKEITGYSSPKESEHDHFVIGHTSTAVSLACGLVKGRDLLGGKENIVAVVGDGSLSGGEAMEGLNVAGSELGTNFIIVVNDNQMSIAENHGGMYRNLRLLRESKGTADLNIFKSFGLDYVYVDAGNDIVKLIEAFQKVKDTDHPIVVHINTFKGKGYKLAEEDKETWHWHSSFDLQTGKSRKDECSEDIGDMTAAHLLKKMKEFPEMVAITAGTPAVFGFTATKRKEAGRQFLDVGIAEETAVAMMSGISKRGGKPVWAVYSTFIQRTYDQLQQDLCINDNPCTILVFDGSLSTMTDVTHTCWYDISLISNIPNLVYLVPTSVEEYFSMLDWSITQKKHPVAIRVPVTLKHETLSDVDKNYDDINFKVVRNGREVAIIGVGNFLSLAESTADMLMTERGISSSIFNPRCVSEIDRQTMDALKKEHKVVVTLEDGLIDGGFGEKIARYYGDSEVKVLVRGIEKKFENGYRPTELRQRLRLTPELLSADILAMLE